MRRPSILATATVALLPLLAACTASPAAPASGGGAAAAPRVDLVVYGAASLTDALQQVATAYEAAHPTIRVRLEFDASSALRAKIEQGAPADVFASADTANADALAEEGLAGAPVPFAGNRVALIVPAGDPGGIHTPADLARPGLRIIAADDMVPIAVYATRMIARLAALPGYPTDFVARVAANVISKEQDVRAVLAKIELGEGDAGFVYATDVAVASGVTRIPVPDAAQVAATYTAVTIRASSHPEAAAEFLRWLTSSPAQRILQDAGFVPPPA